MSAYAAILTGSNLFFFSFLFLCFFTLPLSLTFFSSLDISYYFSLSRRLLSLQLSLFLGLPSSVFLCAYLFSVSISPCC